MKRKNPSSKKHQTSNEILFKSEMKLKKFLEKSHKHRNKTQETHIYISMELYQPFCMTLKIPTNSILLTTTTITIQFFMAIYKNYIFRINRICCKLSLEYLNQNFDTSHLRQLIMPSLNCYTLVLFVDIELKINLKQKKI